VAVRKISPLEMRTRKKVAENIRWMLDEHDVTVLQLASKAKVSKSQLFNLLLCKSSPSTDFLSRIAHAFNLEPAALLE